MTSARRSVVRGRCALIASFALPALCALLGLLCSTTSAGASITVPLEPGARESVARITILAEESKSLHLALELPALEVDTHVLKDATYQTILFGQSELFGEAGEPALPAFTRFCHLPAGAGATVRIVSMEEETLQGYRVLPMQEDEGTSFCLREDVYARDAFLGGPAVELGPPAVMRGQRLVPLTWRPVTYNPARDEIRVIRRMEIALDYHDGDMSNPCRRDDIPSTPAFDQLLRSVVVEAPDLTQARGNTRDHLGTWLIISRSSSSVLTELQPLVDWRRKQGYNVVQATTTQTGTDPSAIKAWIQNAYDTWEDPPEYIVIVGDYNGDFSIGSFTEYLSGYDGVGDHPYVKLDGSDNLPDAFIGRLSAQTTTQLRLIVRKIIAYEQSPYLGRDWFSRACLVGDIESVSGMTCRQVQQWVKERLVQIGYAPIDTVWNSPYESQMEAAVRRGVSYFGYRGYYGMSGWDIGDIYATRNGRGMMPFAVNLTCDTGTWYSGTSRSEAWLLAGTYPDSLKGGVASIGTATTGTATRYNNCFYAGVAYGMFWENHYQTGPAHARGKVEMVVNYGVPQPSRAEWYCYWNTLMGDPATDVWSARPTPLTVDYPASVALGANQLTVEVTDSGDEPVAGAWVHLFRDGQISNGARTDASGQAVLPLDGSTAGTVQLTVSGHNLYPHRGSFTIQQQPLFVGLEAHALNDGSLAPARGNGNGILNPGEQVEVTVMLRNFGTQAVEDVVMTAALDDPDANLMVAGPVYYGDIGSGASASPDSGSLVLWLQPATLDGQVFVLELNVQSSSGNWTSQLELTASAPDLVWEAQSLTGCGAVLDPGESAQLAVTLRNDGTATAAGPFTAYLLSDSYEVTVTDPQASFSGTLGPGSSGSNSADPFGITAPADCIPGLLAPLRLALTFADGVRDTAQLLLTVGTAATTDPTGPDAHGYLIYDQTDVEYPEAPTYNWIDIKTVGAPVGLNDYGPEQDDVVVVDLPFPFTFYGQTFDRATISSNGYLSLGPTYLTNYRNWYMPSAEGPANMIAPFWDDLYQFGTGRVYHWHDAANHRYVVSWDGLYNNAEDGVTESCEAILYDPAHYPTLTGDGVIVFQFKKINQVDFEQMYCTCGIQNADHTVGLTYNYYNRRPLTATWFIDGLALKITTGGPGAADAHTLPQAPPRLALRANEPNPCRAGTTIHFALDRVRPVELRIFDVDGRLVQTLFSGSLPAGEHALPWPGDDAAGHRVPSGIYYYRLETEGLTTSRPLLLLK